MNRRHEGKRDTGCLFPEIGYKVTESEGVVFDNEDWLPASRLRCEVSGEKEKGGIGVTRKETAFDVRLMGPC